MSDTLINIKDVALKNNCPECFSKDGLRLTFKQKIKDTKFYRSITSEIIHELTCSRCDSIIYPGQWTHDIDLVFKYHEKSFTPKRASTYLKKTSWIVIVSLFLLITLVTILFFYLNL